MLCGQRESSTAIAAITAVENTVIVALNLLKLGKMQAFDGIRITISIEAPIFVNLKPALYPAFVFVTEAQLSFYIMPV